MKISDYPGQGAGAGCGYRVLPRTDGSWGMAPRLRLPSSAHPEVTHPKATCFLAGLSVYILMDSLP